MRKKFIAALALSLILVACQRGGTTRTQGSPTPSPSPTSTGKPSFTSEATVNPGGYGWVAKAGDYQGLNGQKFEYGCPPAGQLGSVYGTATYTDDSQVCTAAVHDGKLKREEGGQVVIEIRPGEPKYEGSDKNGVTSAPYEQWGGSFVVVSSSPFAGTDKPQTGGYGWTINASTLRGFDGLQFVFVCPAGGKGGPLYGTETYTDDSGVCNAGVHVGKLTAAKGGRVIIEIKPGQQSYTGSEANGVSSSDFGEYDGSFSVVSVTELTSGAGPGASPGKSPSPTS
jgi:hypothetical protein